MTWSDLAAPVTVSGLMGEIFYFIAASDAVRGNRQRRLWIHRTRSAPPSRLHNRRDGRIIA
jgi:hypothetical protein